MARARAKTGTRKRAGAIHALELLFVFPILMAIFFGTVEYGLYLAAQARLSNAAREGARAAAAGGDINDVALAVKAALPAHERECVWIQAILKSDAVTPLLPGDPVTVNVSTPAMNLVPDYLRFIGVSIYGHCLMGQTTMRKE